MTLTDFLLARIAERVAAAKDSLRTGYQPPAWGPEDRPAYVPDFYDPPTEEDQKRVAFELAECEALRRIVAEHAERVVGREPGGSSCATCQVMKVGPWPCPTLRHLASIYAGHADYREEWRA